MFDIIGPAFDWLRGVADAVFSLGGLGLLGTAVFGTIAFLLPPLRWLGIRGAVICAALSMAFYAGYHARNRICAAQAELARLAAESVDQKAGRQVEADEASVARELAADDAKAAAQLKEIEGAKSPPDDRCRLDAGGLRQLVR